MGCESLAVSCLDGSRLACTDLTFGVWVRSAALTAATLMLAALWAAPEKALEFALPAILGQGQQPLSGVISAAFAVVLVTAVRGRTHLESRSGFRKGSIG